MNNWFLKQHTLGCEVWGKGVGLHSGLRVSMRLKPARPNYGIRFCRMDIANQPIIAAHQHQVSDTLLATSLGFDGACVSTVEHLMAAFLGSSIDNVLVELDGPEVPIFDGSATPYLELLRRAGIKEQQAPRQCLKIQRPLLVKDGDAYIKASPADTFGVRYIIDFPHPLVGRQEFFWSFSESAFAGEIAKARTFGFLKDVQKLKRMGMARGGSLANAIVFDDGGLLNRDGFRYADECVRHKILDFLGDLALAGMPLVGHFEAYKAGHALHNRFLRQLITKSESYAILPFGSWVSSFFHATTTLPPFWDPFPQVVKAL